MHWLEEELQNLAETARQSSGPSKTYLAVVRNLVQALAELTTDTVAPPLILVTHHLDEIPPGMTHVLMLREGQVVASGPIGRVLTSANLSDCFGVQLTLDRRDDGRFSAWSPRAPAAARDPM